MQISYRSEAFKVSSSRRGTGGEEPLSQAFEGLAWHSRELEHFLVGDNLLLRALSRGTKWSHLLFVIICRRHCPWMSLVSGRGHN